MRSAPIAALVIGLFAASGLSSPSAMAASFIKTADGKMTPIHQYKRKVLKAAKVKQAAKKVLAVKAKLKKPQTLVAYKYPKATRAQKDEVIAKIKEEAPDYGVPVGFALRIALIESSYNPFARGPAGEYGVYQMKCDTARMLGFKKDCSKLVNADTNIHYGLTHLGKAVRLAKGDLKLAASKHNGGLGRKTYVLEYVARVFAKIF
jgi:soluble lytic murein transglycosylase-like protein